MKIDTRDIEISAKRLVLLELKILLMQQDQITLPRALGVIDRILKNLTSEVPPSPICRCLCHRGLASDAHPGNQCMCSKPDS